MTGETFERLVIERKKERHVLRLYVTGMSPRSTEAVATVKGICRELLAENYDLEIVDLYRDPARAREGQVIASPTLVREAPLPVRRVIGNLGHRERIMTALNLAAARPAPA